MDWANDAIASNKAVKISTFGGVRVALGKRRAPIYLPFLRRVWPPGSPPGALPGIVLVAGDQLYHRVCRSQRNTLGLYGEALRVREARQVIVTGLR